MLLSYARLESQICIDEGFRAEPYLDTVGVWTIGYGTTSIDGHPVVPTTSPITEARARHILRSDLYVALIDTQSLFDRLGDMNDCRQEVLCNMAYNLGKTRLGGFHNLLLAASILDYVGMAAAMKDSKWFVQVGNRGWKLHTAMLAGHW